jgi:uncharacterized membrane protein
LALNKKNPAAAVSALQAATSPLELGQIGFVANISCLYHVYVRGEAHLAAGQGSAAAAEFQKVIDHSGIVWKLLDPVHWRIWVWLVPTRYRREPRREGMPMPPA